LVCEKNNISLDSIKIASEIWDILLIRLESNFQIKSTKLMGLESEFKNFRIQEE
jgi:hypothetical protein